MEKDTEITPVVFRKFNDDGSIIALFPTIPGTYDISTCESYMHIGQHGSADLGIIEITTLAKLEEYQDLFEELENIGYNLKVYQKCTRTMFEMKMKELRRTRS